MTDDNLTIGELGAYTNNSMNKEGIKKLVDKVNSGTEAQGYTKAETDALLDEKQDVLTAGTGIIISEQNIISEKEFHKNYLTADFNIVDENKRFLKDTKFMLIKPRNSEDLTDIIIYGESIVYKKGSYLNDFDYVPFVISRASDGYPPQRLQGSVLTNMYKTVNYYSINFHYGVNLLQHNDYYTLNVNNIDDFRMYYEKDDTIPSYSNNWFILRVMTKED